MVILPVGGQAFLRSNARLAPHVMGGSLNGVLCIGSMFLTVGSLLVNCEAIRVGAHYDIPASGFYWKSKDGICYAFNETPFTGGGLMPSGNGVGTLIEHFENENPLLSTMFVQDEDA